MDKRLKYKTRNYKTTKRKHSRDLLDRTLNRTNKSKRDCMKQTNKSSCRHLWLMPAILATQISETRRNEVQSQPTQVAYEIYLEKLNIRKGCRAAQAALANMKP
jgi:hypothetical protein